ncbi:MULTISPECIES: SOUL family heme-binding protein [unclassified Polaribacter]|uniref:SOUL family heme-binding protein n=1 Tax=unclassified Polaribacter TaxID=196858 RepID=UPI0011BFBB6D|nr:MULTISPECIES: heme-binding protein [unclassified Polaribacter]TXD54176.1 heme-binding protein [Polaribacter sp. IC063]TXD62441.1 heme-binding protein [Polaribacter sp. IC066]
MKIVYIILGILIALFVASQIFFMSSQKNIEQYPFKVVKTYDNFEIRNYEATLFTAVKLATNEYDKASSKGFSVLAGYIFGGNEEEEKIAMTSPVAMTLDDTTTMMFMVPKKYTKENLPTPNDASIEFKEIPAKKMAAITFGGWADSEKIESYKKKLIAALEREGIKYSNNFLFLGYNAPFEVFNRKNEVIVELE